ncbi:MAG: type III secretion system inner membrane ring subunit SctD [Waddliaceae bacterium]
MGAKLIAEHGELQGLVLSLEKGEKWLIGRDPDHCQLLVEDPSVSRKHLLCRKTPDGILIENLSETNPALLNAHELTETSLLKDGDTITLGSEIFRFFSESTAEIVDEEGAEISFLQESENKPDSVDESEQYKPKSLYEDEDEEAEGSKGLLAEIDYGLTESGRWLLKVIGGPNNGAEFSMEPGKSYVIGTDSKSCDVVFHDTSVSRQHARISLSEDEVITVEDLGSRNGTFMDGEKIEKSETVDPNNVITVGTTSLVIYDRDGEMQTIISPLLPSIVKILQKEEEKEKQEDLAEVARLKEEKEKVEAKEREQDKKSTLGGFMLTAMIIGLLSLGTIGIMSLFQSEPIEQVTEIAIQEQLKAATSPFSNVRYTFNNTTRQLLLVGHVRTATEKSQLMYSLQGLNFINQIDDGGVVIDEYVWREINQILSRTPRWRGIAVSSPEAGQFVLSGYLETRSQAEELSDYLTANFPYPHLLDIRVVVEEDIANRIEKILTTNNIHTVTPNIANGELTLTGRLTEENIQKLNQLIPEFREINGVRLVRNQVTQTEQERSLVDISDRYQVSGFSRLGSGNVSVIIDGKILSIGDTIDGMRIEEIDQRQIVLRRNNVQYIINYRQ